MKCPIQKIFIRFLTILAPNFKKEKYFNFLKTQIYHINCYYNYKNKEQKLKDICTHKSLLSIYIIHNYIIYRLCHNYTYLCIRVIEVYVSMLQSV